MCKKTLSLIYIHALKCLLRNTFLETPPPTHTHDSTTKTTASKQKCCALRAILTNAFNRYANYEQIISIFASGVGGSRQKWYNYITVPTSNVLSCS